MWSRITPESIKNTNPAWGCTSEGTCPKFWPPFRALSKGWRSEGAVVSGELHVYWMSLRNVKEETWQIVSNLSQLIAVASRRICLCLQSCMHSWNISLFLTTPQVPQSSQALTSWISLKGLLSQNRLVLLYFLHFLYLNIHRTPYCDLSFWRWKGGVLSHTRTTGINPGCLRMWSHATLNTVCAMYSHMPILLLDHKISKIKDNIFMMQDHTLKKCSVNDNEHAGFHLSLQVWLAWHQFLKPGSWGNQVLNGQRTQPGLEMTQCEKPCPVQQDLWNERSWQSSSKMPVFHKSWT